MKKEKRQSWSKGDRLLLSNVIHTRVSRTHNISWEGMPDPATSKPNKAGQAPPLVFSSCNKCVVGEERANVQCASFLPWRPLRPWETRAARQGGRRRGRRRLRWSSAGTAAPSPRGTPPPAAAGDRRGRRGSRERTARSAHRFTHEISGNANHFSRCFPPRYF